MPRWLSFALIILLVVILTGLLCRVIRQVTRRYGPSPWVPKAPAQQNLAKPIMDYIYANLYCGNYNDRPHGGNYGPLWSRLPNGKQLMKPDGSGTRPCPNEVDMWLNGYMMETLANYTVCTGDTAYDFLYISSLSNDLLYQLLARTNGVWNDDAMWYTLAFLRMYEVTGYYWFIVEASTVFNWILDYSSNTNYCNGVGITVPWWVVTQSWDQNPMGMGGYRNAITISQCMDMAGRLYDLYPHFQYVDVERFKSRDLYWHVMQQQILALKTMKTASGLLADGNLGCVPGQIRPEWGGTYIQGAAMEGFVRAARIAFERGEVAYGKDVLNFILDLIDLMTLPAERNVRVPLNDSEPGGECHVQLSDMVDCGIGDKAGCQNAGCCFDNRANPELHPFCYKPVNFRYTNPYLAPVKQSNGETVSILVWGSGAVSWDGCGNDKPGGGYTNTSCHKGLLVRFLSYAIHMLENDLLPNWGSYVPKRTKALIAQAKQFLYNNLNWVYVNGYKDGTCLYTAMWELNHDQTQKVCDYNVDSTATFAVLELINACGLLGCTPPGLKPIPSVGPPFVPPNPPLTWPTGRP